MEQAQINRKDRPKYTHIATFEEIVEKDYNLNIPRYVNIFEEEEVSLDALSVSINDMQQQLDVVEAELTNVLHNLFEMDGKGEESLENFIQQYMQSQKE